MKPTLHMAYVTEFEWESGWGSSNRPDGIAFHEDKLFLTKWFDNRKKDNISKATQNYNLFEEISSPKLVRVSDECYEQYKSNSLPVLWLRGDKLKDFMKGIEL